MRPRTRCLRCGIRYGGRQPGETCFDRSTGIKRLVRGQDDRVRACDGRLVTLSDYNRAKRSSTPNGEARTSRDAKAS